MTKLQPTKLFCLMVLCTVPSLALPDADKTQYFYFAANDEADPLVLKEFLDKRLVLRYAVLIVDTDAIRESIRNSVSAGATYHEWTISLFDGQQLTLRSYPGFADESTAGWGSGIVSWGGQVLGYNESWASMIISPDGTMKLTVQTGHNIYYVESVGVGALHVMWQRAPHPPHPID